MDALELDIENFTNNIGELATLSKGLVERGHFDSSNIAENQVNIGLDMLVRRDRLCTQVLENWVLMEFHVLFPRPGKSLNPVN